ncbi:hypothetical protein AB4Z24_13420 [Hyphomicrobium sp. 2TAF46]
MLEFRRKILEHVPNTAVEALQPPHKAIDAEFSSPVCRPRMIDIRLPQLFVPIIDSRVTFCKLVYLLHREKHLSPPCCGFRWIDFKGVGISGVFAPQFIHTKKAPGYRSTLPEFGNQLL